MMVTFPLGRLLATPGALRAFQQLDDSGLMSACLARHAAGDWGNLGAEDLAANDRALRTGERLLSAYHLPGGRKVWIITEWDRSVTTVLLPSEY